MEVWRTVPERGETEGGSSDVGVQTKENTNEGKAMDEDCLWRPWNFAEKARGLLHRALARLLIARGTSFRRWSRPSAICVEWGLRTRRWGVGGIPGRTASTPT